MMSTPLTIADLRPRFSEHEARGLAQDVFGIRAVSMRSLPSDRDQNFHVTSEEDREFVLKIASAAERKEVLDVQNQAMARIAAHSRTVMCPRVCATVSGEKIAPVEGAGGAIHLARMLTYLPGVPLALVRPHTPALIRSLGRLLGTLDRVLEGFDHPAVHRTFEWDLKHVRDVVNRRKSHVALPERRALVERFLDRFEAEVVPVLPELRTSVIHNDANNYNVLVGGDRGSDRHVSGLIDFGDMVHTYTVGELAIAAAYATMDKADPLAAASHMVAGYHAVFPLTELELEVLFFFICMRLCTTACMAAYQRKLEPENEYLSISERPAWALLEQLEAVHPRVARYTFRHACGLPPCPQSASVAAWLKDNPDQIGPVVASDFEEEPPVVLDLSVGSLLLGDLYGMADARALTDLLFGAMKAANTRVGIGRYDEARRLYTSDLFGSGSNELEERRTVHIGMDLFMEAGSPVFAPLDGTIHSVADNAGPLNYGPTLIVQHRVAGGEVVFYTLYGHLSPASLEGMEPGRTVKKGECLARLGDASVNGGWPPHLHVQVITDLLDYEGDFPGVVRHSEREVWLSLCPDPNLLLHIPEDRFPEQSLSQEALLEARGRHLGKNLSLSYRKPLSIVRGFMQYLYDYTGRAYLDAVNNVPHVGHSHPRVVRAAQRQMAVLNTNTRYLHEHLVRYAERLCATLPDPLRVCFFVNSGSEANDLALRLARTHTGRREVIVLEGAYHGNLTTLIEISPYKHDGPGGTGTPPHIHKVTMPDPYRGAYRGTHAGSGRAYSRHVCEAVDRAAQNGPGIAAFIAESLLGCGGQIELPATYLREAYRHVRDAGGVCIADEVQVGFGRMGTHFWGFGTQSVVPDIVTLGKPIGNGHPLGAVVTTPEIAASFHNGMEYFNTFGGNPVSCAVGMAVLDVIEEDALQAKALHVGAHLKAGLERLAVTYPVIGDVRGRGLFIGVELVRDRVSLEPAAGQAAYVVNRMRERGILLSTDGPLHNVLKIKPPLVFTEANADLLVETLGEILEEDGARVA
ncbi:MAG: aminotransferase class III-fold pyridoxal phosphate-dependent enzyme [Rhodothermales bacterium]